jgi:tetratricopeptide (TPR) repeat protein
MSKITVFICLSFSVILSQLYGQDYAEQFKSLAVKDTLKKRILLEKWEKQNVNDPELYLAYSNYFFIKSVSIDVTEYKKNEVVGKNTMQIVNQHNRFLGWDTIQLNKSVHYLDKGIEKFPTRLEIRFAKIELFSKTKNYEILTEEIIKVLNYSAKIKNKWICENGLACDEPEELILNSIHEYQVQMYTTKNDSLLDNIESIAENILKFYPKNIESLNNLSAIYTIRKNYKDALKYILQAEKLKPENIAIRLNIANIYALQGKIKEAKKYYDLVIQDGDDYEKRVAKMKLMKLE